MSVLPVVPEWRLHGVQGEGTGLDFGGHELLEEGGSHGLLGELHRPGAGKLVVNKKFYRLA